MSRSEEHVVLVLGTRPEIIKLAPVIRHCEARGVSYRVVHTGQHYSENLTGVFFDQLELPAPDYDLGVGSGSHAEQTGEMIIGVEEVLREEEPATVLVQGDTNSVLAGAIAASKLDARVGHVEAGLRSFDREMPEETNRVTTDHIADDLYAPTETSADLLRDEAIDDARIHVTGNTVVDAVEQNRSIAADKSTVLADLGLTPDEYALMTVHRQENVDDRDRFESLLAGVGRAAAELGVEVVYPIHPRAADRAEAFGIEFPENVRVVEAQDYLDFLRLEENASVILTDSGGAQEEACILGVPCVTLRENTERPETTAVGANRLVGADPDDIVHGVLDMHDTTADWENPFGDGTAAEQIVDHVRSVTHV